MANIISIASGKGGVGKSFFSANLAMGMKNKGYKVLLVDGDLGGANLHNFVGLKTANVGIYNFLKEKQNIENIIIDTPAGIKFIGGASDILGMAHITNYEKLKIINTLKRLNYDFVIMDLGAGTSYNMIDFFNFSDKKIIIMNSEPTSIENSYGFIKIALYRMIEKSIKNNPLLEKIASRLRSRSKNYTKVSDIIEDIKSYDEKVVKVVEGIVDNYKVGMVLNMLKFKKELNVFFGFENVAKKYLNISMEKLGFLPYDLSIQESLKRLEPFYFMTDNSFIKERFDEIADNIIAKL
ncbi:flagellar biosynthesis protein FlhG [Deferribacter desulfuricans SSM1]|uniref:Flagellar biosynthesis protein FlhG n=1 Tax=Deferribacter desulfuricans (strain DSM 14783 / JCM 11476 / NBRC 101012 / SSM1) TaxID=639282 RepID=D3P8X0_DEFDS|nr:P-loop NTPase [Deferribacter desulfuricans]BAI81160.1 flagellar biosynthesis protein FlhG [Deferribacter desulfuricans SSM1]